nr:RNA polymerase subunit sigma [Pseudomonadota bacterium]NIS71302.1 RNA polymerase subunit sigma [Pseudomonadota bacterium]
YSIENTLSDDSGHQLLDVISDERSDRPFTLIDHFERVAEIESWLGTLSSNERRVISYRYGLGGREPMTLDAIGKIMGVTRERIRQIENKSLLKLRRIIKKKEIAFEETV